MQVVRVVIEVSVTNCVMKLELSEEVCLNSTCSQHHVTTQRELNLIRVVPLPTFCYILKHMIFLSFDLTTTSM